MEKGDTAVSYLIVGVVSEWIVDRTCPISDIGSGNYEPAQGQTLSPPVTNYGATSR